MASKFDWQDVIRGFKTILSRNALLIMAFYILNQYSTYFKNGFRSLLVLEDVGLPATVLGLMISMFLAVGMFTRSPSGSICDKRQDKLKTILIIVGVLKAFSCLLYIILKNEIGMWICFFFDAIVWSFTTVAAPAVLAKSVDKKAMGSAYAMFMGLQMVAVASARPLGAKLFGMMGAVPPTLIAAGIQLLAVLCVLFMDGEKLAQGFSAEEQAPTLEKSVDQKAIARRNTIMGICLVALPISIANGLQMVSYQMDSGYGPAYANVIGLDYTVAASIGGSITGVVGIIVGFLCDFMNPYIPLLISFLGQAIAPFMIGSATTQSAYSLALLVFFCTKFYEIPVRIVAMKSVSMHEQGAAQGTVLLVMDLFSIICSTLCGAMIDQFGYRQAWINTGIVGVAALVVLVVIALLDKKKRGKKAVQIT